MSVPGLRNIVVTMLLAVLAALASAPAASGAEPIEGSWFFDGGEVLVEPRGAGAFVGTVVRPTRLATCVHPPGERMWAMSGSGSRYSGTHQWFRDAGCVPNPGGQTTWDVGPRQGGGQALRMCTRNPDVGGPPLLDAAGQPLDRDTHCLVLERARPALPRPTFVRVVKLPPRRTTTGCNTTRRLRVDLREPRQDPLVSAVVRINGKVVRRVDGNALRRAVVLRGVPRRRATVVLVVRTASGKVLRGKRAYRACPTPSRTRR